MATRRTSPQRQAALTTVDDCLNRVRRAQTNKRLMRDYAERAKVFLPPLSLAVVAELHRNGPRRLKVLARQLDVDLPRISREVRALQDSGHLELSVDAADGRARVAQLTEFGAKSWVAYRSAVRAALVDVVREWSDEDLAAFAALFDRFLTG